MPLFEYKAVSPSGETVRGTMEAASEGMVIAKLQEGGNIPLSANEAGKGGFSLDFLSLKRRGMNTREVGQFTQQLATLLGAGLPLDRSLQVLLELSENDRIKQTVTAVRDQVREGGSLSDALDAQHGSFSRLFINMVRAGEIGGSLDTTLDRLADYLERSKDLKDSVVSAMVYPIMLMILAGGSLVLLLVYVIPQFTPIFEELGGDLAPGYQDGAGSWRGSAKFLVGPDWPDHAGCVPVSPYAGRPGKASALGYTGTGYALGGGPGCKNGNCTSDAYARYLADQWCAAIVRSCPLPAMS